MRLKKQPEASRCFSCGGELTIRRYECAGCGVSIEGAFERNRFADLSPDAQNFLALFIKNRGNLRELERELKMSYPTVRNRLNRIIRDLGLESNRKWTTSEIELERSEIIQKLSEGELTPEQAEERLIALNKVQAVEDSEADSEEGEQE